ncbi:MAG: radical SAM protein, partial [Candidatus Omnitrophota bacterium]
MIQTEITIKKAPAYCFKKLDCYLAISTVTGDFYDVSEDTYTALTKWNDEIVLSIDSITAEQVREMAERYRIPKNIYEKFPLYNAEEKIHDHSHTITHMTDLTLNITSQCNLQCIYCWNDRGKYSNTTFQKDNQQLHHSRENMTPRVAKKAVDILVALCKEDRNLVVDFYGGEPLENLDTLLETVDYCRDNEKRWNVHFHFLLATNGTLLTPSVAKVLIEKGVQIAISIDGHQQIHDHNRPYANGDGSYHCIQENLNAMP